MGTGPGVSGRRAASRPSPGLPSGDSEPGWAGSRGRHGEGQICCQEAMLTAVGPGICKARPSVRSALGMPEGGGQSHGGE
ncbi:hypothetical protein J1605_000715 [Eschrichtius robustus]|uniref:Uncharacterized protein n=1 Tax=Eschrichtius robustus TaxID=9764 RepID=A0AB34GNB7_ESCRO|nr:hypothetical protein J1605_000715 [Eschrichtius robustus]